MPAPHALYSKVLAERTASRNVFVLFYFIWAWTWLHDQRATGTYTRVGV
jgi:hypothetical protein